MTDAIPDDRATEAGAWALTQLETAQRRHPTCISCGSPTVAVARAGAIWLQCAARVEPRSRMRRLFSLDGLAGHTLELILTTPEAATAA